MVVSLYLISSRNLRGAMMCLLTFGRKGDVVFSSTSLHLEDVCLFVWVAVCVFVWVAVCVFVCVFVCVCVCVCVRDFIWTLSTLIRTSVCAVVTLTTCWCIVQVKKMEVIRGCCFFHARPNCEKGTFYNLFTYMTFHFASAEMISWLIGQPATVI